MLSSLDEAHLLLSGTVLNKEIVVRYYASGEATLSLDISVERRWKDAEGQRKRAQSVVRTVLRDQLAEQLARELKPGDGLYLRGQLRGSKNERFSCALHADYAQRLPQPPALCWNRLHLLAQVKKIEPLYRSTAGKEVLSLTLALPASQADAEPALLVAKLWGYPAKLLSEELNEGQRLAIEGSLLSRPIQREPQQGYQHWLDGHTAVVLTAES